MTDTIMADIKEILDIVTARPIAQHFSLQGGLAILGRRHMIDNRLDFGFVKDPILAAPFQISDRNRGGNFMAENPVKV